VTIPSSRRRGSSTGQMGMGKMQQLYHFLLCFHYEKNWERLLLGGAIELSETLVCEACDSYVESFVLFCRTTEITFCWRVSTQPLIFILKHYTYLLVTLVFILFFYFNVIIWCGRKHPGLHQCPNEEILATWDSFWGFFFCFLQNLEVFFLFRVFRVYCPPAFETKLSNV